MGIKEPGFTTLELDANEVEQDFMPLVNTVTNNGVPYQYGAYVLFEKPQVLQGRP